MSGVARPAGQVVYPELGEPWPTLFDGAGQPHFSRYTLVIDAMPHEILVPTTADGREFAEAWLAKWLRLTTPRFNQATRCELRVNHG